MSTPDNREAAFIAKITASTTHELRNVLAIVKESAGLIEDMLLAVDQRGSKKQDILKRALSRIESQVNRGAEIMANLNRFAHSLDETEDRIDLNRDVEQIAFLCQSFARQKNHLLKVLPGGDTPTVALNSLRLQMAVFTSVRCCMEQLPEPGTITLRTGGQGGRSYIEFTAEVRGEPASLAPAQAGGWNGLEELLHSLGATLEMIDPVHGFRLVFSG